MPLVEMKDMLHHAHRNCYGVGAFDLVSLDFLEGILRSCEGTRAPVILSLAESHRRAGRGGSRGRSSLAAHCPIQHQRRGRGRRGGHDGAGVGGAFRGTGCTVSPHRPCRQNGRAVPQLLDHRVDREFFNGEQ
jgi:hypothetical protein